MDRLKLSMRQCCLKQRWMIIARNIGTQIFHEWANLLRWGRYELSATWIDSANPVLLVTMDSGVPYFVCRTQKAPMNIANVVYGDRSHFASKTPLDSSTQCCPERLGRFHLEIRIRYRPPPALLRGAARPARSVIWRSTRGSGRYAWYRHGWRCARVAPPATPSQIASTYLDMTTHQL